MFSLSSIWLLSDECFYYFYLISREQKLSLIPLPTAWSTIASTNKESGNECWKDTSARFGRLALFLHLLQSVMLANQWDCAWKQHDLSCCLLVLITSSFSSMIKKNFGGTEKRNLFFIIDFNMVRPWHYAISDNHLSFSLVYAKMILALHCN